MATVAGKRPLRRTHRCPSIVFTSNEGHRILVPAHAHAGIDEYWIVDARGDDISFQILRWTQAGYVAAPTRAGWRRSRVFESEFRLLRKTNDLGLLRYTLEIKATNT